MKKKKKKKKKEGNGASINGLKVLDAEWPIRGGKKKKKKKWTRSAMEARSRIWLEATSWPCVPSLEEEKQKEGSIIYCWTIEIGRGQKSNSLHSLSDQKMKSCFKLNALCVYLCLPFLKLNCKINFGCRNKKSKHTFSSPLLLLPGGIPNDRP